MTNHINPGTDTTINPVIINDTHRERRHNNQPPKEHCDHECVCWAYRENKLPARKDPCPRNSGGAWASCTEDTRSRPHPAPFPVDVEITIDKRTGDFDIDLTKYNKEIRHKAREDVLKEIREWSRKHGYWYYVRNTDAQHYHWEPEKFKEFLESLRSTQQQAGEQQESTAAKEE